MNLPLTFRILAIAVAAALLLFAIAMIEGKIAERRQRADVVVQQFAAETTRAQIVVGPLLALTCEEIEDRKPRSCPTAYFSPQSLRVEGTVAVESLKRGIYPVRFYRAGLELSGEFAWPEPAMWNGINPRKWNRAYVVMLVSDTRGIRTVQSSLGPVDAQARAVEGLETGFNLRQDLGDYPAAKARTPLAFAIRIELAGTSSLHVAPVGETSDIRLASPWPHPSFSGGWSPQERSISAAGFEARWRTTHLATGGSAFWDKQAREGKLLAASVAGVSLFDPVNVYALSYRATEYAFLFVLFTFAALALTEVLAGVQLHPIQYALVGAALAVFFLLLIALSEHMDFRQAYAIAAVACIALLTFYLRHPLGTFPRTAVFTALFGGLYTALFVVLGSEDHALLTGSLLVFALLALAMVSTRKLDWRELGRRMAARQRLEPEEGA